MISVDEAKQISIRDYLQTRGIESRQNGRKWFCSSPFSRDTNWSFAIYPNNTFYCWSTGRGGDIIRLVQLLENLDFKGSLEHLSQKHYTQYKVDYKKFKDDKDFWKDFDIKKYINTNEEEIKNIISYGKGRSIHAGFYPGVYFTRDFDRELWVRHPAMMFPHQDIDGNIVGAKFRNIYNNDVVNNSGSSSRFTSRGRLGFYILDTEIPETYERKKLWLCESETSANSLWSFFRIRTTPAIIISMGGVSSAPKELPVKYNYYERRLIIDYDGDEKLYQERLKQYEHLNAKPIKLILPKGEDINSLYHKKELWKIEQLLV